MAELQLKMNPIYTVYVISGSKKYKITPNSLDRIDAEGQIAQRVEMELSNVQVDGVRLSSLLQPTDRVYIYADDGKRNEEIFRGFLWEGYDKSSNSEKTLKLKAYDNLIYLQESEGNYFFSSGMTTNTIVSTICKDWGINLNYSYHSITNGKLALTGNLYDMLTSDILDVTKQQTGDYYVVISEKDTMTVKKVGSNTEIYKFQEGENVSAASSGWTMDGVITQVVVVGKADDEERVPVEFTESQNTSKYGTLQKINRKDEDMDANAARKEAQVYLEEHSEPKQEYEISGPDIPWIRKGDAVQVNAGDIKDMRLIVKTVHHVADLKKSRMTITLVDASKRVSML